jgi:hypothetical protein
MNQKIDLAYKQLQKYQKCIESEILTNNIYANQYYWLKVDTYTIQRMRDGNN